MDDRDKLFLPPKSSEAFEDLCHRLFKAIFRDPLTQKHGRRGQAQHGVDIYGTPEHRPGTYWGVQCKTKRSDLGSVLSVEELNQEVAKAEHFEPPLERWILATTSPVDAELQSEARRLSTIRTAAGLFAVDVLGWGEISELLCTHKEVLAEFYPGHGVDVHQVLATLQDVVRDMLAATAPPKEQEGPSHSTSPLWRLVRFGQERDLGPALMGRSLGPRDVAACPTLPEATAAIADLHRAYATRIVGPPGSGKSICAYQAAAEFSKQGWPILRLVDPVTEWIDLHANNLPERAVFLIDDAHLTSGDVLRAAEEATGPDHLLLSTHNAVAHDASSRSAIVIDAKRAVRTIASALRAEPERTLETVRRIDDRVGRRPFDVPLEHRIAEAERSADVPWQFCFVLGGGWRRAENLVSAARSNDADVTLAGIAIRQIASRDDLPSLSDVCSFLDAADLDTRQVETSLAWLISNRLVAGPHDLRCPHQRFAEVALRRVLQGQDTTGREQVGRLLRSAVRNEEYPLAGQYLLLQYVRLGDSWRWKYLLPDASLQPLIRRCWQVTTPEGRTFASLVLSELQSYLNGWPHIVFKGKEQAFGEWISDPSEPSGYGLARAIHAVRNKDEQCAKSLVEASSAPQVAKAVSRATPETAYNLGELLSALHSNRREQWGRTLLTALDRPRLIGLARDWPLSAPAWAFANLCEGISAVDTALALKMVEGFAPVARTLLSSDPLSAFRDLQEVFMRVLRLVDVLGIYKGKSAPTAHHRQLARSLLGATENRRLAQQLSASKLRDFQLTGYLLELIREVAVAKFRSVADAMDWERIGRTIDAEWKDLPHDAEVLLQVAAQSPGARSVVARVVRDHLEQIESFSPRLVLLAPEAATEHARRGGVIRIARHGHVDWYFGAPVIAWFAQEHPSLLAELLEPSLPATARSFSQPSPTWYEEAAGYVELLRKLAPSFLARVLDAVAAEGAEKGWSAALREGGGPRQTVALLVESSMNRTDDLGELGLRLRKRFPRSSVPRASRLN